ncbi:hypothetical protein [Paenibacillus odorifer]|uniref:hypothetical protein n=1 Tax=Paenibacillus odorifer TaxID=189426 RepID=UPI00096CAFF6|nr:hypothetical protein [Paenibacillus odorifer]OME41411.1 hypothetical protein BSK58_14855 [Paenibacillus odorifer]
MSQCIARLHQDFIKISSDSRSSVLKNGEYFAMNDDAKKIEQVGDKVIFLSGSYWVLLGIIDQFKSLNFEEQTISNLRDLSINEAERFKSEYPKEFAGYNEKARLVELLIATFENEKGIIYNISSTNNFEITLIKGKKFVSTIYLGPYSDYIDSHFKFNNFDTVHYAYESVASEQVGGWHEHYELTKDKIEHRRKKIKDTKVVKYYDEKLHAHLNATDGIKITSHGEPVFYVDTDGILRTNDLVGKRLRITTDPFGESDDDVLLLDAESRKLYLNRWDIVGAGAVDAKLISANMISAELGYISDIVAKSLSTMTRAAIAGWSNFIEIKDKTVQWITGHVTQGEHISVNGKPMYWVESSETGLMTDEVTRWPVYKYLSDDSNKKVKMEAGFKGEGAAATPYWQMGEGDNGIGNSAIYLMDKYNGGLKQRYGSSNYDKERSIDLADDGIFINSENGKTVVSTKDFTVTSENGSIKIGNTTGALFEITSDNVFNLKGAKINFDAGEYSFK